MFIKIKLKTLNNLSIFCYTMSYYKFRKCDKYSFESIENQTIYFATLHNLNDLFEGICSIREDVSKEVVDKLNRRFIYCISEGDDSFIKNNHYMWTHYADNFKGFCIEYNDCIFDGFQDYNIVGDTQSNVWMRVIYTDSCTDAIDNADNIEQRIGNKICYKKRDFERENEIRLVLHDTKEHIHSRHIKSAIKAIYLGCRISIDDKMKLIGIATKLKIPCYQMCLANASYTLEAHRINVNYEDLCFVDPNTCQLIDVDDKTLNESLAKVTDTQNL